MPANAYIPAHFPPEYATNFETLSQQKQSKLEPFVMVDSFAGKSKDYNQIGAVDFSSILARSRETNITDTPLGKRRLTQGGYDKADLFDEWDETFLGQIALPKSEVIASHVYGWNRLKDTIIATAALGDAIVPSVNSLGIETTTATALPSSQKVAIDYVESGSTVNSNLTIAKLRKAKFLLDDADVDDEEPRVLAITAKELQSLLRNTEIASADYNSVKALVEGKVDTFLGFKFVRVSSTKVLPAVGGVRKLPAFVKSGIKISTQGPRFFADVRADKSHSLQLRHTGLVGAVRLEEVKVVEIAVDTTLL